MTKKSPIFDRPWEKIFYLVTIFVVDDYEYLLRYLIQKTHFLGRPFIGITRTPEVAIR